MKRNRDNKKSFREKRVGSSNDQNPELLAPIFSFEKMQTGSGYSVDCCERDHQSAVAKRIFKLSQMTWRQIHQAPKQGLGAETISRDAIKVPLPPGLTDDVTLLALRYSGRCPMIGYKDERIFYILLLDHNFSVYDHG